MFDLNQEIRNWCQSVAKNSSERADRVAELEDHLFSAIEQLTSTGLSEREAFAVATKRLGNTDELNREYAKNKSRISTIFRFLLTGNVASAEEKKERPPIWATVAVGLGFLFGGLAGMAFGLLWESEGSVVIGYVVGALCGATAGVVSFCHFSAKQGC